MSDALPLVAVFGGLAAVLCGFAWLASHVRRRGTAGGGVRAALASWEEAYRVTSHESYQEIKAQQERKAPLLSPDGHWRPSGYLTRPGEPGARASLTDRPGRRRTRIRRLARRLRTRH